MKVYKYELQMGPTDVRMPVGARFLAFGMQNQGPVLWAEVDPAAPAETREFDIVPTGYTIPNGYEWRGTVQEPPFVWHLYERKP